MKFFKVWSESLACILIPGVALAWSAQIASAARAVYEPPLESGEQGGATSALVVGGPPIVMYDLEVYTPAESFTPQQLNQVKAIAEAMSGGEVVNIVVHYNITGAQSAAALTQAMSPPSSGEGVESPVDSEGNPLPPPAELPEGHDWKRVPGTESRPIRWNPDPPVPSEGGGQPSASWDSENGHWDVDNGLGTRTRMLPDGTIVDHDNVPTPEQTLPDPFTGIDLATVAAFAGIGLVAALLAEIIIMIIGILSGWGLAWDDSSKNPDGLRVLVRSRGEGDSPSEWVAMSQAGQPRG
ncbi:MAG: hypothetical protein ACF8Q5_07200 [Phycisphaerales bacterium JB040]